MNSLSSTSDVSNDHLSTGAVEGRYRMSCPELLHIVSQFAEPFSERVALIPGERNRRVDFWIRCNDTRFEVWPKGRLTSVETTIHVSSFHRSMLRGEIQAQSEDCLLRTWIDEGKLFPGTRMAAVIVMTVCGLITIANLTAFLISDFSTDNLKAGGVAALVLIFTLAVYQLIILERKRAIDNDRIHLNRYMAMLSAAMENAGVVEVKTTDPHAVT